MADAQYGNAESLLPVLCPAILLVNNFEGCLELFGFTREYVERLREGDPSTEQHFVAYFDQLIRIKLRSKFLPLEIVEELRQDTYIRALIRIRKGELREPERLGAFVNSICNNTLKEFYRKNTRFKPLEESHLEKPDPGISQEGLMISAQTRVRVREVLEQLPQRDRDLLRSFFLDDKEKDEVCREFGVDRDYFRVLLHRAKDKFRVLYEKDRDSMSGGLVKGQANETN